MKSEAEDLRARLGKAVEMLAKAIDYDRPIPPGGRGGAGGDEAEKLVRSERAQAKLHAAGAESDMGMGMGVRVPAGGGGGGVRRDLDGSPLVPHELDALLHRLWTKAVARADYVKDEWKRLEHDIYALGAEKDTAHRAGLDLTEKLVQREAHITSLLAANEAVRRKLEGAEVQQPACTCGEWTEENPVTCPRHDTHEEAERVRQLLLATAQRVRSEKLKRGEVECGAKDPAGWGGTCNHPPHGPEREHQYQSTRAAKPTDVTHILHEAQPLCRFTRELPGSWPAGHYWVRMTESKEASCPRCRTRFSAIGRHVT